jgi:hypothetical protein
MYTEFAVTLGKLCIHEPLSKPILTRRRIPAPELVGRDALQEKAKIALHRLANRRPAKSMILVGLRGVELQYLSESEMGALIMALHRVSPRSLPLTLVGAGLPQVVGVAGRSKSYAERLFDYPEVGPLSSADAGEALRGPVGRQGASINGAAIEEIIRVAEGYPYSLQGSLQKTDHIVR